MKVDPRATLQFRQEQVKGQIVAALDLLEGTCYQSPSQDGYHLTRHVKGKTLNRYVRKRLVARVQAMVQNRARVEELLTQLSEVNWRLLQLPPED
jgi:hypothetical protein